MDRAVDGRLRERVWRALIGAMLATTLSALHWQLGPDVPLLGTAAAFVLAAWPLWHRQREEAGDVVHASFMADWRAELVDAAKVAALVLPLWCVVAWAWFHPGPAPSPSARATVDVVFAFVGQWLTVAAPEEWFWRGYLQPVLVAAWAAWAGGRPALRGPHARVGEAAGAADGHSGLDGEGGGVCPRPWLATLPRGAVAATALFALAHLARQPPLAALATFVPGLLFAALYMRRGRVLGASVLHALCNATSAALL